MPGMNSGLSPGDPILVAAFRSALLHQGVIAALMLAFLWLLWATARTWRPAAASSAMSRAAIAEPRGRWLLRTGFGVLWIFDGILQAQPKIHSTPNPVRSSHRPRGSAVAARRAAGGAPGRQVRAVAQSSQSNASTRRTIAPWCSRADLNAATRVGSLGLRPEFMPGTRIRLLSTGLIRRLIRPGPPGSSPAST